MFENIKNFLKNSINNSIQFTIQLFLKNNPVFTKILQIYASQNESVKFLSNVGGETFTKEEITIMEDEINKIYSREFGKNIERNELEVIGCGTIGRVYRHGPVVFKVQIPGIVEKIKYNYAILYKIFLFIDIITRYHYHLTARTRALMYSIDKQYNFKEEIKSAIDFQEDLCNFNLDKYIYTPTILEDLCSDTVICMEYIEGISFNKINNLNNILKDEFVKLFFANMLLFNVMHVDLHGGNVLLTDEGKRLCILDFGMTQRRLEKKYLITFIQIFQSLVQRDIIKWLDNLSSGLYLDKNLTISLSTNQAKKNKLYCYVLENFHKNDDCNFSKTVKILYDGLDKFFENENIYGDVHLQTCDTALMHFVQFFTKHQINSDYVFYKSSKDILEILK